MIEYKLEDFKDSVSGKYIINSSAIFKYILTDSRLLSNPTETAFFAISGNNHDGHRYIEYLYEKGVRNFIIEKELDFKTKFVDSNFLIIEDTVLALQGFAKQKRENFDIPIIGITGSNGKTIIKEWLFQLLHKDKLIIKNPKSYNSQIGVPLSVWLLEQNAELGIFEAGISKPDEMANLEPIIKPQTGIFINISDAHQENFIDYEQKIVEKLKLFKDSETILYCKDNELIRSIIENDDLSKKKLISWSRDLDADLKITKIIKGLKYSIIYGIYNDEDINIKIPFSDDASIDNSIFCLLYLLSSGYNIDLYKNSFEKLTSIAMRLEIKQGINNCIIINDSYNSDLVSLNIALDFLNSQKKHKSKTIVLSDILQTNQNEEELYKNIANIINTKDITKFIGIGKAISKYKKLFNTEKYFFDTTENFKKSILNMNFKNVKNETILLKGAREFEFEKISDILQKKIHETILEIDLESIISNYNHFRSLLNKKTKLMVMVKAFSYGSGSYEIANLLQFHGVDYLAVAYIDEGIELRNGGITIPIMVMNPKIEHYNLLIDYKLEPELYNFRTLELFSKLLKDKNILGYPIHLKLDTGMKRLGFVKEEIENLIYKLEQNKTIKIKSIFSHLSASEDKESDEFTKKQLVNFEKLSSKIMERFNYPIIRHILNSAGIERFLDYQFDMVRLGIGLYGFSSIENKELEGVSKLISTISQIKNINKNDRIGYNRKGVLSDDSKIAIIPIGYADGLNRGLGNGIGSLYIDNNEVPIIGNISMDMCAVDVTGLYVNEGDEVIIFKTTQHIKTMAKKLNTIPYEIMTNISQRVKRVYYQ